MAWLAVDGYGSERVFEEEPIRGQYFDSGRFHNMKIWTEATRGDYETPTDSVELPKGSIEKLIGHKLSWEDGAVYI